MKKIIKDIRTYFMLLLGISVCWFVFQLMSYPVLPMKYLMIVMVFLIGISILLGMSQYKSENKNMKIVGKIGIVSLSALLLIVNYSYLKTVDLFSSIVQSEDTDVISVIVKKDSDYQTIDDLQDKVYATLENKDEYVEMLVKTIGEKQKDIHLKYYNGVDKLVTALMDEKVDCLIMNESYRMLIEESFETFTQDTRVICTKEYQTKLEQMSGNDVTKETFNVFVSGIDTYGTITTKSRSDVNMIMTVNPMTKHILLTSIPRDYYVPFRALDGKRDKLTHSGLFGVNETRNNVADYFKIDIDYYLRVNFTSVVDIVDAIGGIEVNNPRAFLGFEEGNIHLNGKQALKFSRIRKVFAEGDKERGRNQMRVITGIINKVCTPSIMKNYMSLLDSLHNSFQTNLTDEQLLSLIRMQIADMGKWTIETNSVNGIGKYMYSPVYGSELSMVIPDDKTVDIAKEKINALFR